MFRLKQSKRYHEEQVVTYHLICVVRDAVAIHRCDRWATVQGGRTFGAWKSTQEPHFQDSYGQTSSRMPCCLWERTHVPKLQFFHSQKTLWAEWQNEGNEPSRLCIRRDKILHGNLATKRWSILNWTLMVSQPDDCPVILLEWEKQGGWVSLSMHALRLPRN